METSPESTATRGKIHLLIKFRFFVLFLAGGCLPIIFIASGFPYLIEPWMKTILMAMLANGLNLYFLKKEYPESWQMGFQFRQDIIFLTLLVHFTGGLGSPVIPFYFFILFLYALFLEKKKLLMLSGELCFLFSMTVFAEYQHWLAQFTFVDFQRTLYRSLSFVVTTLLLADLTLILVGFFMATLAEKIEENRKEIQHAESLQRKLIENVDRGVVTLSDKGTILTVNRYILDYYSLLEPDVKGMDIRDFFSAYHNDRRLGEEVYNSCVHKENVHYDEVRTEDQNGEEAVLYLKGLPLSEGPQGGVNYLLLVENTTERGRLRDKLRQADRLATLGLLAAGLVHEINNPLAGISSTLQNLHRNEKDEHKKHSFDLMQKEVVRVANLLKRLLNYSRKSDPGSSLKSFLLLPLVDETLELFQYAFRRQRIKLEWIAKTASGVLLDGDAREIKQVFINLVQNAIQSMPRGGTLRIRCKVDGGKNDCEIEVSDTGTGVPDKNLERIFEPFFTTKEPGTGTGLGLAVCRNIVKNYGGRLTAKKNTPRGMIFCLSLKTHSTSRERGGDEPGGNLK